MNSKTYFDLISLDVIPHICLNLSNRSIPDFLKVIKIDNHNKIYLKCILLLLPGIKFNKKYNWKRTFISLNERILKDIQYNNGYLNLKNIANCVNYGNPEIIKYFFDQGIFKDEWESLQENFLFPRYQIYNFDNCDRNIIKADTKKIAKNHIFYSDINFSNDENSKEFLKIVYDKFGNSFIESLFDKNLMEDQRLKYFIGNNKIKTFDFLIEISGDNTKIKLIQKTVIVLFKNIRSIDSRDYKERKDTNIDFFLSLIRGYHLIIKNFDKKYYEKIVSYVVLYLVFVFNKTNHDITENKKEYSECDSKDVFKTEKEFKEFKKYMHNSIKKDIRIFSKDIQTIIIDGYIPLQLIVDVLYLKHNIEINLSYIESIANGIKKMKYEDLIMDYISRKKFAGKHIELLKIYLDRF